MTLQEAVEQYAECKRAMGASFDTDARVLRHFSRCAGPEADCGDITPEQAQGFLSNGGRCGPNSRARKHATLSGFYRYAISRGWARSSPLPPIRPTCAPPAPPYVYSREEVRSLLEATQSYAPRALQLEPDTFRVLLTLLYGTGLRRGEALRLRRCDLDWEQGLIHVRHAKGGKERLVALCPELTRTLADYDLRKRPHAASAEERKAFFVNRDGTPLAATTVGAHFRKLREAAGIRRTDGVPRQPCLHDLRHNSESRIIPSCLPKMGGARALRDIGLGIITGRSGMPEPRLRGGIAPEACPQGWFEPSPVP